MRNRLLRFGGAALLALAIAGCGGDDGADGKDGAPGKDADMTVVEDLQDDVAALDEKVTALTEAANPETCTLCHTNAGDGAIVRTGPAHQELYKQFYQDGVIKVTDMALVTNGTNTTTLTFKMTKAGAAFDCRKATGTGKDFSIGSYWTQYVPATKQFLGYVSLVPAASGKAWDASTNLCTYTKTHTGNDMAKVPLMATTDGVVSIYGVDEILEVNPEKRLTMGKYPFAGILKTAGVNYVSAANVAGCELCHTVPYLKHAYIYGKVDGNAATDFNTCRTCHADDRQGGHIDWQILKDDPARYAEIAAGSPITAAEQAKYAYKAKLMNDVHMSHAMEFAYPQSMKNCVTCHAGKLDKALADEKFQAETCISCHSVDGLTEMMSSASFNHSSMIANPSATDCTNCHSAEHAGFPTFRTIHEGGYDPKIYTSTGVRYSSAFKVKIDSTSIAGNKLTIKFSATESPDVAGLSVSNITPTVLVGLYGYNSKDFLVAAHGRDFDDNGDGVKNSSDKRNLEYVWGDGNPRFTPVKAENGSWEVTADLTAWAGKIADGSIKRAEIAVMPALKDAGGVTLGLDAPSRTFDLAKNAFDDVYFKDIVKMANGCNTCHDQLATTFHSGDRGGNIKVCRICHEVSNAGSHLELQSRSIDSYIHSIHSFQAFDPGELDFSDPVDSIKYEHHIGSEFPRFGILNCESCHVAGMYNVPDQAKSMPGVLSGTDAVNADRNIGALPPSVTGPAVRACGGCHRAQKINADDSSGLTVLTQHFRTFGYVIDTTSTESRALWEKVTTKIMGIFNPKND